MKNLLKNISIRVEKKWDILLIVLALVLISILITPERLSLKISSFLQALAIVTLVLITWYYAKQTRSLAEEQKNTLKEIIGKRNIDFLERRLNEFYMPATFALAAILNEYNSAHLEGLKNSFYQLMDLNSRLGYFASKEIRNLIREFLDKFKVYIDEGDLDKLRGTFPTIVDKLGVFLQAEYLMLENKIRDFYK